MGSFKMSDDRLRRIEESRRVLVIAPHPDDEALGCGGLIAKLAERGARFHFVFVTDGGASHPNSRSWRGRRLIACRKAEAEEALRRLGVAHSSRVFLGLSDSAMPPPYSRKWESAKDRIESIARRFQPDLALLPWRRDPHCDHRESWNLARMGLRAAGSSPLVLEYAIWLDELGRPEDYPQNDEAESVLVDIAHSVAAKRAAVDAHQTQTTALIDDDPSGFRLTPTTIARLTKPTEAFWWPLHACD
jgi:LmbE family N-acetylglucosaminyl deacetylase